MDAIQGGTGLFGFVTSAVTLALSLWAGAGLTEWIRHGHRITVVSVLAALSGAISSAEWDIILIGAVVGAMVGVLIDWSIVSQTAGQRARTLVVGFSSAMVFTLPAVERFHWRHTQATLLGTAAVIGFLSMPILMAVRKVNWQQVVDRYVKRKTGVDSGE